MLDPIIAFFERIFRAIGRGIGLLVAWIAWPFLAAHGWYRQRNWLIKGPIVLVLMLIVAFYGQMFWRTQVWNVCPPGDRMISFSAKERIRGVS